MTLSVRLTNDKNVEVGITFDPMFLQTEDIWNALKQKLETLSQNLSDDRRRLAACIHEAGHEIYLRDAGFKNILYFTSREFRWIF